jgi:hypothetical protein
VNDGLFDLGALFAGERRWVVVQADCRTILPIIPTEFRRIIVCDPPYGKGHYKTDRDVAVATLLPVVSEARTVALKGYAQNLHTWLIALGLTPVEWVTWFPTNYAAKAGGRWTGLPRWHEDIAVSGVVPGAKRLTRKRKESAKTVSALALQKAHSPNWHWDTPSAMGDVWEDPAPAIAFQSAKRLHPNESPLGIMLKLVELCSNPGDTICDPFAGSASLGVACLRLGRNYVGIEVVPEWAALCRERLAAEEQGSTLQASRAGQVPLFGGVR